MQAIDLLVTNARIMQPAGRCITGADTAFAVRGGVVLAVGKTAALARQYAPERVLDAAGQYVVPGFVNTHTHLFQVLTKGLGKGRLLWDWLNGTLFAMTPYMDEEAVYWAALAGCLAAMRTGVTTTLDFNYLHCHPGQFDAVCQAFTDSGMRGYVGRHQYMGAYKGLATTVPESCDAYRKSMETLVAGMKNPDMLNAAIVVPLIIGMLELPCYHGGYLRGLRECAEALGIPYTAHVAETADDDGYCVPHTGHTTVRFMEKQGFLGPRCVLAHCVCMEEGDYEIFRRCGVKVSYNPVSNMILASGIAPVQRLLDEGICVSLGTDGSGSNDSLDMLETLKMGSLLQKVASRDARALPAEAMLEMATLGGARALCRDDLGEVKAGKKADFFLYNPSVLRCAPVADAMASLVYASGETSVSTVVVNGRIVLEKGQFTHVNEAEVVENVEKAAARVRQSSAIVI